MSPDGDPKHDVEAHLRLTPKLDSTDIAVSVHEGVVMLSGYVRSFYEKQQAEATAKCVPGVVSVANDLQVSSPVEDEPTDPQIARAAVAALRQALPAECDGIMCVVTHGVVRLEGNVTHQSQRETAGKAVSQLRGVLTVHDLLQVQ